jgi:hypothetical protein
VTGDADERARAEVWRLLALPPGRARRGIQPGALAADRDLPELIAAADDGTPLARDLVEWLIETQLPSSLAEYARAHVKRPASGGRDGGTPTKNALRDVSISLATHRAMREGVSLAKASELVSERLAELNIELGANKIGEIYRKHRSRAVTRKRRSRV